MVLCQENRMAKVLMEKVHPRCCGLSPLVPK